MNAEIFISFSLQDDNRLEKLLNLLKNQNYKIYIRNKSENYDEKYGKYIEPLLKSKLSICFVTRHYINDDYCQSDLIICKNNKIPIVILFYDNLNTDQLINKTLDLKFIFNLSNDIEHFECGYGLNFAKFKAAIDSILTPSSILTDRPNTLDFVPKIEQVIQNKLDLSKNFFDAKIIQPEYHFNCRYDVKNGSSKFYTRTVDVTVSIKVKFVNYSSTFCSISVIQYQKKMSVGVKTIRFTIQRNLHHKKLKIVKLEVTTRIQMCN
jgi:hypothetical protein